MRIAVLGVKYKGGMDVAVDCPAEKKIRRLMRLGTQVSVYDPYCDENFGAGRAESVEDVVMKVDCARIFVIPEYSIGTVLGLIACLAAFGIFRVHKRKRL